MSHDEYYKIIHSAYNNGANFDTFKFAYLLDHWCNY